MWQYSGIDLQALIGKGRGKEKVWGTFPFPSLPLGTSGHDSHQGSAFEKLKLDRIVFSGDKIKNGSYRICRDQNKNWIVS